MQVIATLIAAQQAAREAQARFQAQHVAPKPQASFAAALDDLTATPSQPAPAAPAPQATSQTGSPAARMGSRLDITI